MTEALQHLLKVYSMKQMFCITHLIRHYRS